MTGQLQDYIQEAYTTVTTFDRWNWRIAYLPIAIFSYLPRALITSPFWFYATNPGIETGGMFVESKYDILKQVPDKYKPVTRFIPQKEMTVNGILNVLQESGVSYPFILKPNNGERSRLVSRITDKESLDKYVAEAKVATTDFVMQDYVDFPIEIGISYQRRPDRKRGRITSLISKELLYVTGDGTSTIQELMSKSTPHIRMQLKNRPKKYEHILNKVPKQDEDFLLTPIAGHEFGIEFVDHHEKINEEIRSIIDDISQSIDGFYYGRYDIRAPSLEALFKGNFKILEVNGTKGEPTRIFDRKHSLAKIYRIKFEHWRAMFDIAQINEKHFGVKYPGWLDPQGYRQLRQLFKLKKQR